MVWSPSFRCVVRPGCDEPAYEIGHGLVDGFLDSAQSVCAGGPYEAMKLRRSDRVPRRRHRSVGA